MNATQVPQEPTISLLTLIGTWALVVVAVVTVTLNIIGNKVILRSEDGSKSTESADLAKDLLGLLTETANRQAKSVMSGQPMELDEMSRDRGGPQET